MENTKIKIYEIDELDYQDQEKLYHQYIEDNKESLVDGVTDIFYEIDIADDVVRRIESMFEDKGVIISFGEWRFIDKDFGEESSCEIELMNFHSYYESNEKMLARIIRWHIRYSLKKEEVLELIKCALEEEGIDQIGEDIIAKDNGIILREINAKHKIMAENDVYKLEHMFAREFQYDPQQVKDWVKEEIEGTIEQIAEEEFSMCRILENLGYDYGVTKQGKLVRKEY